MVMDADGNLLKIVEEACADEEEKRISEVNTGIMAGRRRTPARTARVHAETKWAEGTVSDGCGGLGEAARPSGELCHVKT